MAAHPFFFASATSPSRVTGHDRCYAHSVGNSRTDVSIHSSARSRLSFLSSGYRLFRGGNGWDRRAQSLNVSSRQGLWALRPVLINPSYKTKTNDATIILADSRHGTYDKLTALHIQTNTQKHTNPQPWLNPHRSRVSTVFTPQSSYSSYELATDRKCNQAYPSPPL